MSQSCAFSRRFSHDGVWRKAQRWKSQAGMVASSLLWVWASQTFSLPTFPVPSCPAAAPGDDAGELLWFLQAEFLEIRSQVGEFGAGLSLGLPDLILFSRTREVRGKAPKQGTRTQGGNYGWEMEIIFFFLLKMYWYIHWWAKLTSCAWERSNCIFNNINPDTCLGR